MIPVIAIVGRANVGKSTLFNCLTRTQKSTQKAIVADELGVTRDRQYGKGVWENKPYALIDTGGIGGEETGIEGLTAQQAALAVKEADIVLFVVDARAGCLPADKNIAKQLRKLNKSVLLVINKIDGLDSDIVTGDFHGLGLGEVISVSAAHRQNMSELAKLFMDKAGRLQVIDSDLPLETDQNSPVKIAIVGKPNAGKSTLVNRMLGEERVIVFDMPGTTRDSIYINLERRGKQYILIDTAGVRRKSHIKDKVEKISVVKTLQAIEDSHVVIFLIDSHSNITEQDLHLLGFILELGKSLVIAVNKWDGLSKDERAFIKTSLDRRLSFINFAEIKFISALHGTGVGDLFDDVKAAYDAAMKKMPTPQLTALLQKATAQHQPPLVQNHRIKLRYAHAGGQNPPVIVIHGNQTKSLPESYIRYLQAFFRKALKLIGTPVQIEFKDSVNPYKPVITGKPKFKPHPKNPIRRKKSR